MSLDQINTELAAHIPRDRYGRPKIQPPGGGKETPYTRATTVADTLDDRYNLELWKMRQVALGLGVRPDLLTMVKAHTAADKKIINDVCKQAMDAAASNQGANLGTALHNVTVQADFGIDYDQDFARIIDQYHGLLDDAGYDVVPEFIERFVVLDDYEVGGSFDRLLFHRKTERFKVGDIKCGGGIDYGQRGFAVQLAIYAHGLLYDPRTHERTPLPPNTDLDEAVIIHLPSSGDTPSLFRLDIAAGWEAFEHAMWVRKWRSEKVMKAIPQPIPQVIDPAIAAREQIRLLPPAEPEPKMKLPEDWIDPAVFRPQLKAWFQQDSKDSANGLLYARWRKAAAGELDFQPPTQHRFDRTRAAWRLAVLCSPFDDHADDVARAVVSRIAQTDVPVWKLDALDSKHLLEVLVNSDVSITAKFADDGDAIFTITTTPKGGDLT
jgi:hypothetical protein